MIEIAVHLSTRHGRLWMTRLRQWSHRDADLFSWLFLFNVFIFKARCLFIGFSRSIHRQHCVERQFSIYTSAQFMWSIAPSTNFNIIITLIDLSILCFFRTYYSTGFPLFYSWHLILMFIIIHYYSTVSNFLFDSFEF